MEEINEKETLAVSDSVPGVIVSLEFLVSTRRGIQKLLLDFVGLW